MKEHRESEPAIVISHLKKNLFAQELTPRTFWISYAVYGILTLIAGCCAFSALLTRRALGTWSIHPVALGLLALLAVAAFCFLAWKERRDPARIFALIALPAGLGFALLVLPDHVPDEAWHIYRVFDLFHGPDELIVPEAIEKGSFPGSYEELYWALQGPLAADTISVTRMLEINSNALYFVPGLVVAVLKAFAVNPFIAIIVARLANLALFIVAGFWAIRLMPFGKVILCVYMLSPICLQQEASCSADALTNAAALLFIAYVLHLRFSKVVAKKQMGIVVLLFAVVLVTKPSYFFLVYLLLLLVPHLAEKHRKSVYLAAVAVTVVGAVAVFLLPLSGTYGEMTAFFKEGPLNALAIIARSGYVFSENWFWQFLGGSLGALEINPWRIAILLYAFALFSTVFVSTGETVSLRKGEKAALVAFVALFLVLVLVAFRSWSVEIDGLSDVIGGFQGRYAIPVFILVMLACLNAKSYLSRPNCLLVYSGCLMVVYFFCFFSVTRFF